MANDKTIVISWRRKALAFLPLLLIVNLVAAAWSDISAYVHSTELLMTRATTGTGMIYNGATWRIVGNEVIRNSDRLPLKTDRLLMRVMWRVSPQAGQPIIWPDCKISIADSHGRIWSPLPDAVSGDIARLLDPSKPPLPSCKAVRQGNGEISIMETFLLPADIVPGVSARLSFMPLLPSAISFDLSGAR